MTIVLDDVETWLDSLQLDSGAHEPNDGMCAMEAVAYIAGEPWSDHPQCASPVIGAFMRAWNDTLATDDRQVLKGYLPRLVGSKGSDEVEVRRAWMAADWLVRVTTPAWLRLAGLTAQAEQLEALPELTNAGQVPAFKSALDAARAAAGAAAWDAARAAAGAAAWDAARAAAWDAAGDAAWDAAWAALDPTVKHLQLSALGLLDRMLAA